MYTQSSHFTWIRTLKIILKLLRPLAVLLRKAFFKNYLHACLAFNLKTARLFLVKLLFTPCWLQNECFIFKIIRAAFWWCNENIPSTCVVILVCYHILSSALFVCNSFYSFIREQFMSISTDETLHVFHSSCKYR